jgi:hypothetical protein
MWEAALAIKQLWDAVPLWTHVVITLTVPAMLVWLAREENRRRTRG